MIWNRGRNKFGAKKIAGGQERYGSKRSVCALGHSHRSKLEGAVCQLIQLREKAGELMLLQVEDHVYLTEARIGYIPDFRCKDTATGEVFWIEAKGFPNDRWPILKKLWSFYGPGRLQIFGGGYRSPRLIEEIIPKGLDK